MPRTKKLTSDNLIFHPISPDSRTQKATLSFKNNYGCNVYLRSANTTKDNPYEFELTYDGNPTFHSSISDSNIGYCTLNEISDLISEAQKLAPR